ncbi:hypothetical protein BDW67DRAFT_188131 [Aspergillus spinulosporus]
MPLNTLILLIINSDSNAIKPQLSLHNPIQILFLSFDLNFRITKMMSTTVFVSMLALAGSAFASPSLKARDGLQCGGVNYAPVGDVQNCIDFLKSKGTDSCKVGDGNGGFCQDGAAVILGSGTTETPCQNVAAAAEAIIESCTNADQYVGGTSTIGGNSNVLVTVRHVN